MHLYRDSRVLQSDVVGKGIVYVVNMIVFIL